ncbi:Hsp20/alpha crystallin family protein [Acidihalobacter prosperus]
MAKDIKKPDLPKTRPSRALSPFEEMDQLFNHFMRRGWMRPWRSEWPDMPEMKLPKVDVIDREAEVIVKAEIPGVDKKDIDISVGEDSLTIKGETKHEEKEEKGDYYRSEMTRGAFSRTVALPATVDAAGAKASMDNGVLEISLPKVEKAKRLSIPVS